VRIAAGRRPSPCTTEKANLNSPTASCRSEPRRRLGACRFSAGTKGPPQRQKPHPPQRAADRRLRHRYGEPNRSQWDRSPATALAHGRRTAAARAWLLADRERLESRSGQARDLVVRPFSAVVGTFNDPVQQLVPRETLSVEIVSSSMGRRRRQRARARGCCRRRAIKGGKARSDAGRDPPAQRRRSGGRFVRELEAVCRGGRDGQASG